MRLSQFLGWAWIASATACAMASSVEEDVPDYELVAPTLESLQPEDLVLGDTIRVFGGAFIPEQHGSLGLRLDGSYLDSDGREHPFRRELPLVVVNERVAELRFEELFFHPTGDRIGTFRGTASLVNRTVDDELWSEPQEERLRVGPSIRLDRLGSVDAEGCAPVTRGTNGGHPIELAFQVIGAGQASEHAPWSARVSFNAPDIDVGYVAPEMVSSWPVEASSEVVIAGEPGLHRIETEIDSGDFVAFNPRASARTVRIDPPVTIGDRVHDEVVLGALRAGAVEFGGHNTASFAIEVDTGSRTLQRQVDFDIRSEFEIGIWGGTERLVERYHPEATSGCTPGERIGRDLSYSERTVERRGRRVDMHWLDTVEQKLGLKQEIKAAWFVAESRGLVSWSSRFGVNVEEAVTSLDYTNQTLSIFLLPGHYGMSYRQLERYERTVEVLYHNACGDSGVVGDAILTNWNFGFDVAQDLTCPPPTTLPPAERFPVESSD